MRDRAYWRRRRDTKAASPASAISAEAGSPAGDEQPQLSGSSPGTGDLTSTVNERSADSALTLLAASVAVALTV